MIYLVSDKKNITGTDWGRNISVQESLDMIEKWPVIQFDTETSGFNPHICKLKTMQFGYKDYKTGEATQIVVDCLSVDPVKYKHVLESKLLIGQNLKFDDQFLFKYNIVPNYQYDTYICEQVLYLGFEAKHVSYGLHDIVLRRLGIDLDKSFQKIVAYQGLTDKSIQYAAGDVVYLQDIRRSQIAEAEARNCINAFNLENDFVRSIAYLEWCGIHLDESKWRVKMDNDYKQYEKYKNLMDVYLSNHKDLSSKFTTTIIEYDLFNSPDSAKPHCLVNYDSPQQMAELFSALGFNTKVIDKVSKKEKDSVLEDVIRAQKGIADDFVEIYFNYKEAQKRISTYGQQYINLINPKTGRLHTKYRQLGTISGRMSSGERSSDKDLAFYKRLPSNEVTFCNMQNLSRDAETRSCFVAEKGNVFVSCDYSAEESRVQADVWNEPKLLDCFKNGIDTHNMYAKLFFPQELAEVDVKDVKKVRPDLRQRAKSGEFAIGYGSTGYAIAAKLEVPLPEAKQKVAELQNGMKGMSAFKKITAKKLSDTGYIVIHPETGHRCYWPEWNNWKAEAAGFTKEFWDEYSALHRGTRDFIDQKVKRHMQKGSDWLDRKVLNIPIQGGSALVMKQAANDLFKWIIDHNMFNKILFCVFVHDEIDCECPKELVNVFPKVMETIMENAAAKFYKKLPIPAECEYGDHWQH